jgi:hypothetical protein
MARDSEQKKVNDRETDSEEEIRRLRHLDPDGARKGTDVVVFVVLILLFVSTGRNHLFT